MAIEDETLRRAVVLGSALVYWTGVFVQARRIRKRTGRSANSMPRGIKEGLLWVGWFVVIAAWTALPFMARQPAALPPFEFLPALVNRVGLVSGILLVVLGYAGTLWCYSIMGDAWRMGIDRNEKTRLVTQGPYRLTRHPIYGLQVMMLLGVALLLPTAFAFFILGLHYLCAWIKARDEEAYLLTIHGEEYRAYSARTGRLLPRLLPKA
jgi:protein-S-isoprenylcysteine O-methyltransferase Ste14